MASSSLGGLIILFYKMTTKGKPWPSRHALWYDLGQAGQGFLACLTNFWPHQPPPLQANCRPNFSAFPCQALPVLTPASRGLSRPCRPFMFFCFSLSIWPRQTAARPRRAGPVAAASPVFLSPGQHYQSVATSRAHPGFQAGLWPRSTPVWPGSLCKGKSKEPIINKLKQPRWTRDRIH